MSATVKISEKPCFMCQKTDKTVEVKLRDGTFSGVLCLDHQYQVLSRTNGKKPETKVEPKAEVKA